MPGNDPNALLQAIIDAGLYDERMKPLMQQFGASKDLLDTPMAQGRNVGSTYVASSPLEHLSTAVRQIVGAAKMRKVTDAENQLATQRGAGRAAFMQQQQAQGSPDASSYLDLFSPDSSKASASASAIASAIRQRRAMAALGAVSGDPAIGGAAKEMAGQADKLEQDVIGAGQHRAELGVQQMRYGPSKALQGMTPEEYEAITKRKMLDKLMINPTTGAATPVYGPPGQAAAAQNGISDIADAIISGKQAPTLQGMYRQGPAIRAELAKRGFDLATAQNEWSATQKHLATLQGPQQERLRQAVDFTSHAVDNIEKLYEDWKATAGQSGVKAFNRVTLAAAKQLPGDAGAAAQALEGQINDLSAELGNVYMGGNSPTDHALQLAKSNLSADWNEETFKKAIGQIRNNLAMRRNAMMGSTTAGFGSSGSRYDARQAPPAASAAPAPAGNGTVFIREKASGKIKALNSADAARVLADPGYEKAD